MTKGSDISFEDGLTLGENVIAMRRAMAVMGFIVVVW
jgi:hypothetical protein